MLGTTDELDDPIRVLYVNSDPAFAELVQTKLQQTSTEIDCIPADGIDEALHHLATKRIDCIVTAYSLEDSDGIGLTESIRQQNDDIPILLFTGQGSEEIASKATRAGVSDYIPVRSERDNFTLLAARIRTLTKAARKQTEAEQTKRRFRRTLERATDAIYAVDSDWRIEYMNEKMAERIGRDSDALVGEAIWEEFPSIVGTELEDKYRTAMETGEPVSFEQHLEEPFNYWVEVRAFPDDDGLTVFSREITTERERELKLERSDAILENIHDVVFVLDEQGDIEFANTAAKRLLAGDQSAQLTGQQLETDVDLFRILGATVEAALARASREEELHRQNERLDQFASVVAHDLRNPLSVAMGFLEIAEETGKAEHFEKVESAHDRIERLIEDLLTLARGETTIEDAEEIDLESITTEAWGYVDTEEATLTVADGIPTVTGDAGRLTQLFENLFRNAIEHGGADVTVTVGGLDGDDGFYVEDTGSGIPQEKQDDVFKHGVTSSEGGTGFGLSIVADIAKAHGWTVSVTDGSNGGARFEFKRSK
ncbi:11-domain light and oxygen sensing his kinase [Haloferax gibbonsii ATCC 33959]|uniref:histidine kinase n=1 Tax=Haloferax gibbonsii (strain ATCC 33959 / DSM 4427 / JCM 8863 / NBRC 102184 / NCIMB 2188 / Ma 2.38) TaxID=1227459 RepID=M0GZD4_HALGM|nr:PAS domain-containing protein [Haloferax gibbonsii]ELZ76229.1 11-domain light and oxygen sensing his kinase [Haloferax gibbonsii ATCC 33959]